MNSKVIIPAFAIWMGLCGQSYAIKLSKLGTDKCYGITRDDAKPCKVECDEVTKGGKPRYWKKVCRTYTKAAWADCGCHKKVCKMEVTEVNFLLVPFPKLSKRDDLICSCKQPEPYVVCEPTGKCCNYKQKRCSCEFADGVEDKGSTLVDPPVPAPST